LVSIPSEDIVVNLATGRVIIRKDSSEDKLWTQIDDLLERGVVSAVKILNAPKKRKGRVAGEEEEDEDELE
jgi:hypothetical protein